MPNKPTYPGIINRQDLVDFCQKKLPALDTANLAMLESLDVMERMHADQTHTIHALYEGLQLNYGFQKALREVCEWAKENVVEENPIPDAEEDMSEKLTELKNKFGVRV